MAPDDDNDLNIWLWLAEAYAVVPHTPRSLFLRGVFTAIADKRVTWDTGKGEGHPGNTDWVRTHRNRSIDGSWIALDRQGHGFHLRLEQTDFLRLATELGWINTEPAPIQQVSVTAVATPEAPALNRPALEAPKPKAKLRKPKAKRKPRQPQVSPEVDQRIMPVLDELFPKGVPPGTRTATVRGQINSKLADDHVGCGGDRKKFREVSWDSVKRAIKKQRITLACTSTRSS
jgi:hypothetical protein